MSAAQPVDGAAPRLLAALARLYGVTGLLIPLAVGALLGGALIQYVRPELPGAYTWAQPYRVLENIVLSKWFPLSVLLAYVLGASVRYSITLPRRSFDRTTLVSRLRARAGLHRDRPRMLLRALAAVAAFGSSVAWAPRHTALDAFALACFAAYLVRPWSRVAVLGLLLHSACAALLFTAVCYWFTVVKALTFVNAEQRDAQILAIEHALTGTYPHRWVAAWASERPTLVRWFDWAYFRIFDHMAVTAGFLMGLRDRRVRTEYLGALAICYLLGGPLYLLCPGAGPVYFDPAPFAFLREQQLTVNYVQHALLQNTAAVNAGRATILDTWGYIACVPSLHMAHESVMLYYVRASRWALVLSLAFTTFTAGAVVALGWHYPLDIVAGVALAAVAIALSRWQSARLLPGILR